MQAQGYTIVAVEQTVNSQNLYQFQFSEKTLLLLGYGYSFKLFFSSDLFLSEMNVKAFARIFYR